MPHWVSAALGFFAVLASLMAALSVFGPYADRLTKAEQALIEFERKLSEIADLRSNRPNQVDPQEVAEILATRYADILRGPKGDRGEAGAPGIAGSAVRNSVSPQISIGTSPAAAVRLKGVDWGVPDCTRSEQIVTCISLLKNTSGRDDSKYQVYPDNRSTAAFSDHMSSHKLMAFASKGWVERFDSSFHFNFPDGVIMPLSWEVADVPLGAEAFQTLAIQTQDGLVKFKNLRIN